MSEEELRSEQAGTEKRLQVHWQCLTISDSLEFVRTATSFKTDTRGLNLLQGVVEKVYLENAERNLGRSALEIRNEAE